MTNSRVFTGALAAALVSLSLAAHAQDRRQNTLGEFDFYVLSLSWSPSFCEASAERSARRESNGQSGSSRAAADQQCGDRPYSFVVHGLWPQYERGFPEYCQVPAQRLDRTIVSTMLDIMPAPRLIFHEWDRHGTCSGLSPRAYFDTMRKARALVKIPDQFLELKEPLTVTPDEVEEAFVKANPGLARDGIAIGCDNRRLREVRICLSKDMRFRDCAEVDRRACRRERLVMPPVRGG
jgi:ribonuclease T2